MARARSRSFRVAVPALVGAFLAERLSSSSVFFVYICARSPIRRGHCISTSAIPHPPLAALVITYLPELALTSSTCIIAKPTRRYPQLFLLRRQSTFESCFSRSLSIHHHALLRTSHNRSKRVGCRADTSLKPSTSRTRRTIHHAWSKSGASAGRLGAMGRRRALVGSKDRPG